MVEDVKHFRAELKHLGFAQMKLLEEREVNRVQISGLIVAEPHFKRCSRLRRYNVVELPTLQKRAGESRLGAAKRQLITPICYKDVLDGEAAKAPVCLAVVEIDRVLAGVVEVLGVDSAALVNGTRESVRQLRAQSVRNALRQARL